MATSGTTELAISGRVWAMEDVGKDTFELAELVLSTEARTDRRVERL
jgi:hypothetical protein